MKCCTNCFCDPEIQAIISQNGIVGNCDFCGSKNIPVYSLDGESDLTDIIADVLNVYEESEDGKQLFSLLRDEWDIFNPESGASEQLIDTIAQIIYDNEDANKFNVKARIPRDAEENFGIFSGHTWCEFSEYIKTKNRFHNNYFKPDSLVKFLDYAMVRYPRGSKFYRARICNAPAGFLPEEMGAPPAGLGRAGRVNPAGISVLYLTSDEKTALSEVRAGTFDYVTIGSFISRKEIKLVDISRLCKISPALFSSGIESLAVNRQIFRDIACEIAKPMRRNDSPLEYLPTEFISEFVKCKGYQGVIYKSTMGTGKDNIVVFDASLFNCTDVQTVEIHKIDYIYDRVEQNNSI